MKHKPKTREMVVEIAFSPETIMEWLNLVLGVPWVIYFGLNQLKFHASFAAMFVVSYRIHCRFFLMGDLYGIKHE